MLLSGFVAGRFHQGFIIRGPFFLRGICTRLFNTFRGQLCLTGFRCFCLTLRPRDIRRLTPDFPYQLRLPQPVLLFLLIKDFRQPRIRMLNITAQSLDVIRRLAIALAVSADMLVFDEQERGPDEQLRYQFETISRMPQYEQDVIRELLDAMIIKNQVAGAMARMAQGAAKEES
ncbi:hypothetical protein [Erwinia tasmaniensis]|uniref:hypothetical protein n=1 Tax=Erwinia tasmaniensis TaxID=338565 RepID=UPI003A4DB686